MQNRSPLMYQFYLACIVVLLIVGACSSPSAPEEDTTPADTASTEDSSSDSNASEAGGDDASVSASTDDYQMQREVCMSDAPCWPDIVDSIPSSFQEAPMLAEMVAAGDLPEVTERLPSEPLVIQPTEMIGQYGGTLRRAFTGPGDKQNIERWNNDHHIFWNTGANELRPRIFKAWEANEDASEWTMSLREGMKWSDGAPFTADDYMFWYEEIVTNEQLVTNPPWWMRWGGELATFEKIDETTLKITFAQSFPSWPETLSTTSVAGHFNNGENGVGMVAPKHYLEQFHANVIGEEEANAQAEEAGFENWGLYFLARNNAHMNPELPGLTLWVAVTTIASDEYILERNPYFYAVDTEGNQLPYIDQISLELVEELEVLNLRAIAGNYTVQGRHIDFAKLPVIRENEAQGNYFVNFWGSSTRHPVKIAFSQDWQGDPEIAQYTIGSRDFRKALSLAIERSEINETFFLGVGTEASFCPDNTPPYFNSSRWDEEFGRYDPDEANSLLDSIGLDQKDSEGFRLLPSGNRMSLRIDAVSGAFLDYPSIAERVAQMWAEVGIHLTINPVERSLWIERQRANEPMLNMFETGEWNPAASPRLLPGTRWAPIANGWANTPDPDPTEYDGPEWIKEQVAKHWAAIQEPDPERRHQLYVEGTEIMCDNHARIGIVVDVPVYTTLIKNNVRNIPKPMEWVVYAQTPGNGYPEQFFIIEE
ncbi:ABC transporter substrate-binding protein [Chloroflexi bacterium TSY]|nr:ABC transporter substrate-binding protein [Chloroflexi bacterium TSY]